MQYLLLVYTDPELLKELPAEEYDRLMRGCLCHADELKAEGKLLMSQQLQPVHAARAVRVRDGKSRVTDGPFAETKEFVGGITVIDVTDLDAALAWAGKVAQATGLAVEVRPALTFG